MFLAELETKPDVLVVVNVAPPLFTQPALEAQARGANIVWINVPPMPEVKNALFVASDAFGMGQTAAEASSPRRWKRATTSPRPKSPATSSPRSACPA